MIVPYGVLIQFVLMMEQELALNVTSIQTVQTSPMPNVRAIPVSLAPTRPIVILIRAQQFVRPVSASSAQIIRLALNPHPTVTHRPMSAEPASIMMNAYSMIATLNASQFLTFAGPVAQIPTVSYTELNNIVSLSIKLV